MTNDQIERLTSTICAHGDQLGNNLVHLKRFLERLEKEQQAFLEEQRTASDRAQQKSYRAAFWSAIAAGAAAVAAIIQAVDALAT